MEKEKGKTAVTKPPKKKKHSTNQCFHLKNKQINLETSF